MADTFSLGNYATDFENKGLDKPFFTFAAQPTSSCLVLWQSCWTMQGTISLVTITICNTVVTTSTFYITVFYFAFWTSCLPLRILKLEVLYNEVYIISDLY